MKARPKPTEKAPRKSKPWRLANLASRSHLKRADDMPDPVSTQPTGGGSVLVAAYVALAGICLVANPSSAARTDEALENTPASKSKPAAADHRPVESPAKVSTRGWLEIAKSVWTRIGENRVIAVAAGFTFYAILALFPAITAVVSTYGLFADAGSIQKHLNVLSGLVPGGATDIIADQIKRIVDQGNSTLGFGFVFGLGTALWSANAGMKAMFDALNVAYRQTESRGFIALNALSLLFTVGMVLVALAALGAVVVLPLILNFADLREAWIATALAWSRWPIMAILIMLGLALLYRFGPARTKPAWRWVTPGSVFAALGWVAASVGVTLPPKNVSQG
jgi:YihY family inner membrane protein